MVLSGLPEQGTRNALRTCQLCPNSVRNRSSWFELNCFRPTWAKNPPTPDKFAPRSVDAVPSFMGLDLAWRTWATLAKGRPILAKHASGIDQLGGRLGPKLSRYQVWAGVDQSAASSSRPKLG